MVPGESRRPKPRKRTTFYQSQRSLTARMAGSAGSGLASRPASNSYVPRSYAGPVRPAANGLVAPVTPLTGYRPSNGAAYRLPASGAAAGSAYSVARNRPFLHTCARCLL